MDVLAELWRGNLSPSERYVRKDSEYWQLSRELGEKLDALSRMLSPEGKKEWEAAERLTQTMSLISEEDSFICGFRLGAQVILDVVGDHKRQFYSASEAG